MKITVLTENTTHCDLPVEHGLSLYIETMEHRILFDTGQSDLFADNARRLGVDLSDVEFAVISHGHYDHGGGLRTFLQLNQTAPVYINCHAFEPHFNAGGDYIGLDTELENSSRFVPVDDEYRITDWASLHSCSHEPLICALDPAGLQMLENDRTQIAESDKSRVLENDRTQIHQGRRLQPEDFRHEQYLLIKENGRRILFSGCSHKGILNIMHWFRPDVLIGGFHFMKMDPDERLKEKALQLDAYSTAYYTCHCTGLPQYEYLSGFMKNLHYLSEGEVLEI